MLPSAKVAVVHVARRRLGLDEDAYRALLVEWGGADSATKLTHRGFDRVMDRMRQLGFVSARTEKAQGLGRPGMASAAQLALIWDLWRELHTHTDRKGLDRWLDRHFGVSAARFLSHEKAGRVVGALKAWKARRDH